MEPLDDAVAPHAQTVLHIIWHTVSVWRDPLLAPWFLLFIHSLQYGSGYMGSAVCFNPGPWRGRGKTFPADVEMAEHI